MIRMSVFVSMRMLTVLLRLLAAVLAVLLLDLVDARVFLRATLVQLNRHFPWHEVA
jgi:hypothetical protein